MKTSQSDAGPVGIAHVNPMRGEKCGGAEVVILHLLSRLDRSRYRPYAFIAVPGAFEQALRAQGVEVAYMPLLRGSAWARKGVAQFALFAARNIAGAPFLARQIGRHSIRLIHTNSRGGHIAGILAGRLARVPVIMHVQDLFQRPGLYMAWARLGAYAVVVPSTAAKNWLQSSRLSAAAGKIRIIPSPVDCERFNPAVSGSGVRAELGLENCYPVVTAVGALDEWKGQGDLVRALPQVLERHPTARLLIVGEYRWGEKFRPVLERLIHELRVDEQVLLLGHRDDVPQILAASDIPVLASWSDTYPGVVGEAMASGRAVVATRSGGSVDMVIEGETGLLVAPRSPDELARAIITLADDPALLRQMGTKGRERIVSLSAPEVFVARMEALYEEALQAYGYR